MDPYLALGIICGFNALVIPGTLLISHYQEKATTQERKNRWGAWGGTLILFAILVPIAVSVVALTGKP